MQTQQPDSQTKELGEIVAATYEASRAVASDRATVNELAARRLERVLSGGANMRLVAALRGLARELAPVRVRPARPEVLGKAWTPPSLALAR